jgi:hypothetical protein
MAQTATSRRYYAVAWPYGILSWSSEHGTPGEAISFDSAAARDEWADKGPVYTGEAGYRAPITAAEVRKYGLRVTPIDEVECWEE